MTAETSALDPQGVSYETTIQFENGTQTLTITDGNGRSYTYTLMFEETEPESELTLTGMKIGGIECKIEGRIIEVILPYGRDLSEALKVEYTSSEPGELMIGETTISNGGSRVFGEEKALEVTVKNDEKSKDCLLYTSENPTWTLSNSSILSIEENGNQVTLTALKSGNTILKAEKNGVYAECVIRVVLDEVLVESILLHGPETSLEPGNEALITAEAVSYTHLDVYKRQL